MIIWVTVLNFLQLLFSFFQCYIETDAPAEGFTYNTSTELEGMSSNGLAGYYEGGGYSYVLGRTQESASEAINYLKANDWIDEYTRAIFIEYTTFNNQLNLYSVSFTVFELMPTGG